MAPRSQEVTPAGFWSLNADMLGLVETFVEPKALWALALADQRCRDVVRPRLQELATLLVTHNTLDEQLYAYATALFEGRMALSKDPCR